MAGTGAMLKVQMALGPRVFPRGKVHKSKHPSAPYQQGVCRQNHGYLTAFNRPTCYTWKDKVRASWLCPY